MIKIEDDSNFYSTNSDVIKFLHFNDDDSQIQSHPIHQTNIPNILDLIQHNIDLTTTPIQEINHYIQLKCKLNHHDIQNLTQKILKKKRILKRIKAKNRVKIQCLKVDTPENSNCVEASHDQTEKKRKKNRISAQISRDKKKIYLQSLQNQNRKLIYQAQKEKSINQQLKLQLQQTIQNRTQQKTSKDNKNKFMQLLIFLGIIFLFTTMIQFCKSKQQTHPKQQIKTKFNNKKYILTKLEDSYSSFNQLNVYPNLKYQVEQKLQIIKQQNDNLQLSNELENSLIGTIGSYFK